MPKESQKEHFGCFKNFFGCHVDIRQGERYFQTHVDFVYVMFILFPHSELNL